ncbi:MAG: hypothetical protein NZ703_00585 [Gemmataceae bacterium]|nr:hypothetical protein [Gemmataceae bacterium]MCS7269554.1 hypothetical protein [Gemmataceae bacterium]MDW8241645.1 hypothetical protein [Thermogemmata sp.]
MIRNALRGLQAVLVLGSLTVCGCSNAPLAGLLDFCFPSKLEAPPPGRSPAVTPPAVLPPTGSPGTGPTRPAATEPPGTSLPPPVDLGPPLTPKR